MSASRPLLLDANPLIEAKNRYYAFDICPGFWTSILTQHAEKRVFSIDRICVGGRWLGARLRESQ